MFYDKYEKMCKLIGSNPTAVGRELGVQQGTVSQWKRQGTKPNVETLVKMKNYFGVTLDFMLCDEDFTPEQFHTEVNIAKCEQQGYGIEEIQDRVSEISRYNQLIEELNECAAACAKKVRILMGDNYTPVSKEAAERAIIEEFTDVSLAAAVAGVDIDFEVFVQKLNRWKTRLEEHDSKSVHSEDITKFE